MFKHTMFLFLAASCWFGGIRAEEPVWRGPRSISLSRDARQLFVACQKTGDLLAVELETTAVRQILQGSSLVSVELDRTGKRLLVGDAGRSELLVLDGLHKSPVLSMRISVPRRIADIESISDNQCVVSSSWSHELTVCDVENGTIVKRIPLGFAPHSLLHMKNNRRLLVADAFGGKLAVVNEADWTIQRELTIPGHNIRGLTQDSNSRHVMVSQMIVAESASTTQDNIFWGITMTSSIRFLPTDSLLDSNRDPILDGYAQFLGTPGNGAGDPSQLGRADDGTLFVCLEGVNEVSIAKKADVLRVAVGRRPVALAVDTMKSRAYVANYGSDSISVIDGADRKVVSEISLGRMPKLGLVDRGEQQFHDSRLAMDGWFSCHSCHTDGHTNGQNADTKGDGSFGTPKNVISLRGVGDTRPWAWNGSKGTLRQQVEGSLRDTMRPREPHASHVAAELTAYMRTLKPIVPVRRQLHDTAAIDRGARLFEAQRCSTCHPEPIYSSDSSFDVGLTDEPGKNQRFNPPSLRGLFHSAPYFHDGRATTLRSVFRDHRHKLRRRLSDAELVDLLSFLESL